MQNNTEGVAQASLKVRDDSDDYTTKSFLFNLYINIAILFGSLLIFPFYRWFRCDLKTLGDKLQGDPRAWHVLERLGIYDRAALEKYNWLKLMWKLDEEDLQELQGTDLVIYMKFIKTMAYLFFAIMFLNLVVLMPVYSTEKEDSQHFHVSDYSILTLLYKPSVQQEIWLPFFFVLGNSFMGFLAVWWFKRTAARLKNQSMPLAQVSNEKNIHRLSEKEISERTCIIRNLTRNIPALQAEQEISEILYRSFPLKIVSVRVTAPCGKLMKLQKTWYKTNARLKVAQEDARPGNFGSQLEMPSEDTTLYQAHTLCFIRRHQIQSEEDRLLEKLEEIKIQMIESEIKSEQQGNNGCCFVVFKSKQLAREAIMNPKGFRSKIITEDLYQRRRLNVDQWNIQQAPPISDIIWDKIGTRDLSSTIKSIILYFLLFVICVLLVSPLTLFEMAKPLSTWIQSSDSILKKYLPEYLSPLILIVFNSLIIPLLVDLVAFFQDHETYSSKQLTILTLNFVFMTINTIFIPLTNYITMKDFLQFLMKALQNNTLFESVSKDMGYMGSFFIRYMMQVAFIINVIYLFDIPHFFVRSTRKLWYKFVHRKDSIRVKTQLEPFKDTWTFDLGYFQAYTLTLFFLSILFATVIPLITVFSFLFFFLRFWFDKYNQLFIYFKEFEATGRKLTSYVTNSLITVIILSQLLNFGFMKVVTGQNHILAIGICLVAGEVAVIVGFQIREYIITKKKDAQEKIQEDMTNIHHDSHQLLKLRIAYRHPWIKKRQAIFEYYNKLLLSDPRSRLGRYTDLNVRDDANFNCLKNLRTQCVDRARRAQLNFLGEQALKQLEFEHFSAKEGHYHKIQHFPNEHTNHLSYLDAKESNEQLLTNRDEDIEMAIMESERQKLDPDTSIGNRLNPEGV